MKRIALVFFFLVACGALAFYTFPERVESLLEHTPLKGYLKASTPLYQWKDERGQLQVTSTPPPGNTSFEVKQYALDANVLPLSKLTQDSK
jgi:hypothetical protein